MAKNILEISNLDFQLHINHYDNYFRHTIYLFIFTNSNVFPRRPAHKKLKYVRLFKKSYKKYYFTWHANKIKQDTTYTNYHLVGNNFRHSIANIGCTLHINIIHEGCRILVTSHTHIPTMMIGQLSKVSPLRTTDVKHLLQSTCLDGLLFIGAV